MKPQHAGRAPIIYCTPRSKRLADGICRELRVSLGDLDKEHFADLEPWVRIVDHERIQKNDTVFVVGSTEPPVTETYFDLFAAGWAIKKRKPRRLVAVMPFMGFRRQERDKEGGEAIMAELVPHLIHAAGFTDVILCDIHHLVILKFFRKAGVKPYHIGANPIFASALAGRDLANYVVVTPDRGRHETAKELARMLRLPLVCVRKGRPGHDVSKVKYVHGDLRKKHVLLRDDEISTAGTTANTAKEARLRGALSTTPMPTHGVLSGGAIQRLKREPGIREVILTDTVYVPWDKRIDKIRTISVAPIVASVMRAICAEKPTVKQKKGRKAKNKKQRKI